MLAVSTQRSQIAIADFVGDFKLLKLVEVASFNSLLCIFAV